MNYFLLYLFIGMFSGTLSGLLGLGGGIIVVPALACVFSISHVFPGDLIMHMAIGTSLAAMIFTTLSALIAHSRRGTVRWDLVKKLLPGLLFGSMVGALVTSFVSSAKLQIFFSLFLMVISLRLFLERKIHQPKSLPANRVITVITSAIGMLSALLGAGGGSLLIPFLLRFQIEMRQAAGTSVTCGVAVGMLASLLFIVLNWHNPSLPHSTGFIYWPAFVGVALSSMVFASVGTRLGQIVPASLLKRILAVFLAFVSLYMLSKVIA